MTSNSLTENEERYSLTNFEGQFWIECLGHFLDTNMCGFQYIWRVLWSLSDAKL